MLLMKHMVEAVAAMAILVLLLSCAGSLRGADLLLFEDNTAAMHNLLNGAAAEPQSRLLVASIWLLLAGL